ncbi:MAG: hypothetical protein KGI70_00255 [Patescibacteria group bacterium]|nr:hypothetical protein [Patescibacteria group bacterium]
MLNKYKHIAAGISIGALALLLSPAFTFAQSAQPANCGGGTCSIANPLNTLSFCGLVKNVLGAVIAIGIPIAVIMLVYVGAQFVFAQGSQDGIKKARENLKYTVIGIAIFLSAWLIAQVIANTVNNLMQGTGVNPFISSCN